MTTDPKMTAAMTAVVVDDEERARRRLARMLEDWPSVELSAQAENGAQAVAASQSLEPDIVFLDVQMPGKTGIQMLHEIGPDRVPAVILVTAFEEHALDAFELSVVDYILKPIETDRFLVALDRARVRLERVQAVQLTGQIQNLIETVAPAAGDTLRQDDDALPPSKSYISRFLVSDGAGERPLSVSEVSWIEAAGDYVRLHVGPNYHLVRDSMNNLESALDPYFFGRIHRGAIIRFDHVREIVPTQHGDAEVYLIDGTRLKLSRSHREQFRRALGSSPS
ncbi:MAG: LytTR family DNA-binding domain-containing protein [Acidobacteriota bacterium]